MNKELEFSKKFVNCISFPYQRSKTLIFISYTEQYTDDDDYLTAQPSIPSTSNTNNYSQLQLQDFRAGNNQMLSSVDVASNSNSFMQKAWFHGKISRDVAEKYVKYDGDFLVRESTSSKGQFVLTGMREGIHRHILLIDPEGNVSVICVILTSETLS